MNDQGVILIAAMLAACGGACAGAPPDFLGGALPIGEPEDDPAAEQESPPGAAPDAAGGLPCDVAALLETHCLSCHSQQPLALPALAGYADMLAPSVLDPTITNAERSLLRLHDQVAPMPPADLPLPSAGEVAILAAWIEAGMPAGDCGAADTSGTGGGPSPYDTPSVCTSDVWWTNGDSGSSQMTPGQACIACHVNEGPSLLVAGTVYPTAHEPDDCFGVEGAIVEIVDKNGKNVELAANAAGNFFLKGADASALAMPIFVKVVAGGKVRPMVGPSPHGDCNLCHTELGAEKAPGRVMVP